MSVPVQIRHACAADAEALDDLAVRTFRDTFEADNQPADMEVYLRESFGVPRIRAEIASSTAIFLLAFGAPDAPPIGYAKLRIGAPHPSVRGPAAIEIERIYVRQEAFGHGVGSALMKACLDEAARTGHRTLWLGVWERNERAIAFYSRWEFEKVGRNVFMLGSDPQDDWVMARPVPAVA